MKGLEDGPRFSGTPDCFYWKKLVQKRAYYHPVGGCAVDGSRAV
jgi:hypothetical protein